MNIVPSRRPPLDWEGASRRLLRLHVVMQPDDLVCAWITADIQALPKFIRSGNSFWRSANTTSTMKKRVDLGTCVIVMAVWTSLWTLEWRQHHAEFLFCCHQQQTNSRNMAIMTRTHWTMLLHSENCVRESVNEGSQAVEAVRPRVTPRQWRCSINSASVEHSLRNLLSVEVGDRWNGTDEMMDLNSTISSTRSWFRSWDYFPQWSLEYYSKWTRVFARDMKCDKWSGLRKAQGHRSASCERVKSSVYDSISED